MAIDKVSFSEIIAIGAIYNGLRSKYMESTYGYILKKMKSMDGYVEKFYCKGKHKFWVNPTKNVKSHLFWFYLVFLKWQLLEQVFMFLGIIY